MKAIRACLIGRSPARLTGGVEDALIRQQGALEGWWNKFLEEAGWIFEAGRRELSTLRRVMEVT